MVISSADPENTIVDYNISMIYLFVWRYINDSMRVDCNDNTIGPVISLILVCSAVICLFPQLWSAMTGRLGQLWWNRKKSIYSFGLKNVFISMRDNSEIIVINLCFYV